MAFNAKNLHYDAQTPAFLQRLKAGYAAADGRSNVQQIRPGRSRLRNGDGGDDDDGPVIVDERGEVVEKEEWEGIVSGKGRVRDGDAVGVENEVESVGKEAEREEEERERQRVAGVGEVKQKKRKVVKVGSGGDEDRESRVGVEGEEGRAVGGTKPQAAASKIDGKRVNESGGVAKPKKKTKRIKLSFDEPE